MISESNYTFPNLFINSQMISLPFPPQNNLVSSSLETTNHLHLASNNNSDSHSSSLLHNLSVLKEKFHQIQSVVDIVIYNHQNTPPSMAIATVNSLIQELIITASSMLFTTQQMSLVVNSSQNNVSGDELEAHQRRNLTAASDELTFLNFSNEHQNWYDTEAIYNSRIGETIQSHHSSRKRSDIVELDASDLLAKYTHYCQVCGKGFKRDANLRMHMRAHGDEYKTSAALRNRTKSREDDGNFDKTVRKYSCPHEGCRWNQKHEKFQPLKSLICVKNHYKRSHCPKMYICKRCNRKQFSVLSDLRTHEKHCGNVKWLCSCGTTFSRKDKLLGHVSLFLGHSPVINSIANPGNL